MATKDWKKTRRTKRSWYNNSIGMALWIEYTRGYNKFFNEKGYIVYVGKHIPGRGLYSKPRTETEAIKYAKDYMRKH